MVISIDLPSDQEDALSVKASQLKLPLPTYILRVLSLRLCLQELPKTGAQRFRYWQFTEVIGSRPEITESQAHANPLRQAVENRESDQ